VDIKSEIIGILNDFHLTWWHWQATPGSFGYIGTTFLHDLLACTQWYLLVYCEFSFSYWIILLDFHRDHFLDYLVLYCQ
jgi:hypothetical protein